MCLRLFIAVNNLMMNTIEMHESYQLYTLEYHVFCQIKEVPEYHWVT